MLKGNNMRLGEYIDELQTTGKLWFTKDQVLEELGCSKIALKRSLDRLAAKKLIVIIRSKFVLVVPPEYRDWGIVPADWFIDPLMQAFNLPYYIALLSAGQRYGAAHQKPMQFQVMTNQHLRPIKHGRIHIRFVEYSKMTRVPTQRIMVKTGYAMVSTPEATAIDLCKDYKASGYWSNIATVMAELLESMDSSKLCQLATSGIYDTPVIQRLGYVLSHPDVEGAAIADDLYNALKNKNYRWAPLNPHQKFVEELGPWKKDYKWKIIVNEYIEADV